MNATEINQKLRDFNLLLGNIYKRLTEIKDQRNIKNLSNQLQNASQHIN